MQIKPIAASFGATVTGVDLRQLDEGFAELYSAWLQYALLIFPGQHLDRASQVQFARRFGSLEFDYAPISNLLKNGQVRVDDDVVKILKGNMEWHADSTYMPVMAKGAVFSASVVPSTGGETGWADMRAAYAALDHAQQQRLASLSAYHSLHYSQARSGYEPERDGQYSGYGFHDAPPPLRPLVGTHPETGQPVLTIGRHAYGIPGLSDEDSESLLQQLIEEACRGERVYKHRWQAGDVVVWDNRCLLHRAYGWDMSRPRVMYHSRIAGDPATEGAGS